MIIELRPVFRESIQGRNAAINVGGRLTGTTKAGAASIIYSIPDSKTTRKLSLNFDELVDNPFYAAKKEEANLPSEWQDTDIWKYQQINKQTFYELKHNRPKGFYSTESFDISTMDTKALKARKRTHLQSFRRILIDGVNKLDLNNYDDQIFYEVVLSNPAFFGKNYADAISRPGVRFYISHISEEQEVKATKRKLKTTAIAKYSTLVNEYPSSVYYVALLLKLIRERVDANIMEDKIYEFIESDDKIANKELPMRIKEFNAVMELVTSKDAKSKQTLKAMITLQEAVNYRVVTDYRERYLWVSKTGSNLEELGRSRADALEWFTDPKNKEYVEELQAEINRMRV